MFERLSSDRDRPRAILALRRMWWVIVVVAVISAGGAYLLGKRKPMEYSATASLLFRDSQLDQWLFGVKAFNNSSADPNREPATNEALAEMPTVAARVAQQLHIPESRVLAAMSFGSDAQSDVLKLTATDPDPKAAAEIVNTYAQQYIAFRQTADRAQLSQAEQLIRDQLAAIPPSEGNSPTAKTLQTRSNELRLLARLQTGNAEVVQTASPPTSPSGPHPAHDGMIGLILGLLASGALVMVIERCDRRIRSPQEIEEHYGAPVIGTVPDSNALRGEPVAASARDEDAFRTIRTQLRYFDVDRDIKQVLITSADNDEGKSVIALNLARVVAQTGDKRVILLEADLRRPSLTEMIGLESVAGLAELLSDSQDLASALPELVVSLERVDGSSGAERFDVLTAGAAPPNPVELLESRRMAELMDVLTTRYDMVIIDTHPIGVVGDAIPLLHRADGVLVVSRLGRSRRDHAIRLMKQLRSLNAHVLGVVINGFRPSTRNRMPYYPRHRSNANVWARSAAPQSGPDGAPAATPARRPSRAGTLDSSLFVKSGMFLTGARRHPSSDEDTF
jgi:polysaccharide biosynthesis transport protein